LSHQTSEYLEKIYFDIFFISIGEGQTVRKVTYKDLRCLVALYASGLEELGVKTGDRVVGEYQ